MSYKGARIINFYGELFGIDYALPKMDMCVQPSMGGAMENWGLGNITSLLSYKELH
jgi:aminopeptidase N